MLSKSIRVIVVSINKLYRRSEVTGNWIEKFRRNLSNR